LGIEEYGGTHKHLPPSRRMAGFAWSFYAGFYKFSLVGQNT